MSNSVSSLQLLVMIFLVFPVEPKILRRRRDIKYLKPYVDILTKLKIQAK